MSCDRDMFSSFWILSISLLFMSQWGLYTAARQTCFTEKQFSAVHRSTTNASKSQFFYPLFWVSLQILCKVKGTLGKQKPALQKMYPCNGEPPFHWEKKKKETRIKKHPEIFDTSQGSSDFKCSSRQPASLEVTYADVGQHFLPAGRGQTDSLEGSQRLLKAVLHSYSLLVACWGHTPQLKPWQRKTVRWKIGTRSFWVGLNYLSGSSGGQRCLASARSETQPGWWTCGTAPWRLESPDHQWELRCSSLSGTVPLEAWRVSTGRRSPPPTTPVHAKAGLIHISWLEDEGLILRR